MWETKNNENRGIGVRLIANYHKKRSGYIFNVGFLF